MSRIISSTARAAFQAQETDEAVLVKMIFSIPLIEDVYLINDMVNHTDVSAQEWLACPFELKLPDDKDDEIPVATLAIDNVSRDLMDGIRAISDPPVITLWVCLGSDIDDIIAGPYSFWLRNVTWDSLKISGSLEYEPILNTRWPYQKINAITAPGLYKG